ncbi:exosortase E/protease, VPEID-CTERM system [Sessilibacter corallicola]|uniref:CAAX prenyl protease 2/Lysostaphin resistance protein A-like domain-containing protein n=1 Tax=Sessilibacter corallicola TaxID=2904075 RepID=A0ABQ0AEV9_9GAMM
MTLRIAAIALLLVEVLIISVSFDAQPLKNLVDSQAAFLFSNLSLVIVWLSAYFGAYLVVLLTQQTEPVAQPVSYAPVTTKSAGGFFAFNLAAFAFFFWATSFLFAERTVIDSEFWLVFLTWCVLGALVFVSILAVVYHWNSWLSRLTQHKSTIALCVLLATVVSSTSLLAKNLWPSFIQPTFALSEVILFSVFGEVYTDPEALNLGLEYFIVNISSECSGIEGMGLGFCFTMLYLYLYRSQLKFPIALILLPIAVALSWLFNVIRICLLIFIGEYISSDFAIGGFHSQAGWFTFIALALIIIYLFDKIPFIKKRQEESAQQTEQALAPDYVATAIISTFIVFLLCSLISGFDESTVNWLYPVKALGSMAAILYFWKRFELTAPSRWLESVALGLVVTLVWVLLIPEDTEYNQTFATALGEESTTMMLVWLAIRFLGSIAVAPIVEELMFRGYLLSRVAAHEIHERSPQINLFAIVISSLAFGAIHNQWIAGTAAGVLYAVVRLRGNLSSAILAHSVTNASLCVYALTHGQWSYL